MENKNSINFMLNNELKILEFKKYLQVPPEIKLSKEAKDLIQKILIK